MKCDTCQTQFNYCFYINNKHWKKVVGEQNFKDRVGRICAHCTLEKLGGLDWYIIWNEPTNNINKNAQNPSNNIK